MSKITLELSDQEVSMLETALVVRSFEFAMKLSDGDEIDRRACLSLSTKYRELWESVRAQAADQQ